MLLGGLELETIGDLIERRNPHVVHRQKLEIEEEVSVPDSQIPARTPPFPSPDSCRPALATVYCLLSTFSVTYVVLLCLYRARCSRPWRRCRRAWRRPKRGRT